MRYPDLSPYRYAVRRPIETVLHVGWLGSHVLGIGLPYAHGEVPAAFVDRLSALLGQGLDVHKMRGIHPCSVCNKSQIYHQTAWGNHLLGMSELWIPDSTGRVYATPTLIIHYVTGHHYRPPQAFIDAVLAFTPGPDWNPGQECRAAIDKANRVE